jgi:hypothetical protein
VFNKAVAELADLQKLGAISFEEYRAAVDKAKEALDKATQSSELAKTSFEDLKIELPQLNKEIEKITVDWNQFADNFGRAVEAMILGTISFKEAVAAMVADIAKQLASKAIAKFISLIVGGAADGAVFSGGTVTQAKGGVWAGGVQRFARGGVVGGPTLFGMKGGLGLMGEAGPEAIVPLRRNGQGRLGVDQPAVNVQIINNAGAAVTAERQADGSIAVVIEQARRAIAADIRRGGNMVAGAFEGAYGMSRARAGAA